MLNLASSLKRFVFTLVLLVALTFVCVYLFDQLTAAQTGLTGVFHQTGRALIVVAFASIAVLFIRHSRNLILKYVGVHLASVFQFFMILAVGIVTVFAFLNIFHVSATTLLISGGIVSIVTGLVISTFVGNILAGTLVLMTHPFRVGDVVTVNNVPGRIEEITAMVTKVRSDVGGQIVIPNSAIMQGGIIVTSFTSHETGALNRIPYSLGDRIYTNYLNQEGVVTELTSFYTKILLDSGKELTFLNTTVLTGNVAVAKVCDKPAK